MPFSRHLQNSLTINKFFSTSLKKKGNMQVTTQYRARNLCFLPSLLYHYTTRLIHQICAKLNSTITAEIHARSLANFYCQYADRHINLKFMRRVSEQEPAIRQFVIQPRSGGPLSSSRKYPGYSWLRVYACQLKPHRGWVLNLILSTLSREVNVALL